MPAEEVVAAFAATIEATPLSQMMRKPCSTTASPSATATTDIHAANSTTKDGSIRATAAAAITVDTEPEARGPRLSATSGGKRTSRDGSSEHYLSSEDRLSPDTSSGATGAGAAPPMAASLVTFVTGMSKAAAPVAEGEARSEQVGLDMIPEKPFKVERKEYPDCHPMPPSGYEPSGTHARTENKDSDTVEMDEDEETDLLTPHRPKPVLHRLTTATATRAKRAAVAQVATATAAAAPHRALTFSRAPPPPPTTRGALTILHSLSHLAALVSGTSLSSNTGGTTTHALAARYVPAPITPKSAAEAPTQPLRLHCGETVLLILHRGRASISELVHTHTEQLSQLRLFSLDLSALPPNEYDDEDSEPIVEGSVMSAGGVNDETAAEETKQTVTGDGELEVEEDAPLFVGGPAAPDTQQSLRERHGSGSGGGRAVGQALFRPSSSLTGDLSDHLGRVTDTVLRRVSRLLRVYTVLDPQFFAPTRPDDSETSVRMPLSPSPATTTVTATVTGSSAAAQQQLLLPALVVWRAAGAASEDYSPYLPCSYSDGSTLTLSQQQQQFFAFSQAFMASVASRSQQKQAQPMQQQQYVHQRPGTEPSSSIAKHRYRHFGHYLSVNGGPLVVKQVNNIDQVHSLSLHTQVYTVAHLYKHIISTARKALLRASGRADALAFTPSFEMPSPLHGVTAEEERANAERAAAFFRWLDTEGAKSRTMIYLGASWCPPCMRIVGEMPLLIKDNFAIPQEVVQRISLGDGGASTSTSSSSSSSSTIANAGKALHAFVKADMDLAKPIFDLLQVQVIPTFVILDNTKLFELERRILRDRLAVAEETSAPSTSASSLSSSGSSPSFSLTSYERLMGESVTQAQLGRLQNSQRHLINVFIEKHCTSLSFDEDF